MSPRSRPAARLGGGPRRLPVFRVLTATAIVVDVAALGLVAAVLGWPAGSTAATTAVLVAFLLMRGHYRIRSALELLDDLGTVATSAALAVFVVLVLDVQPTDRIAALALTIVVTLTATRIAWVAVLRTVWNRGHLRARTAVLGTGPIAREIAVELDVRRHLGVDVVGFVTVPGEAIADLDRPVLGEARRATEIAERLGLDRVIVATRDTSPEVTSQIRHLASGGTPVFVLPSLHDLGLGSDSLKADRVRGFPLVRLGRSPHPQVAMVGKRVFDVVVASVALVLLLPVLALTALAVRLTSPGPVLFRQVRIGRGGRPFELLKFRSMTVGVDADRAWTPEESEAVHTPIGRFLRSSSLDELPQLLNIVRGDMSFVGPRPERPVFVEEFSRTVPGYDDRHRVRPGLTGYSQVLGLRGDTPIPERAKFDNLYIDQWTFATDVVLMIRTGWAILRQRHYADMHSQLDRRLGGVLHRSDPPVGSDEKGQTDVA